jgi:predicted RNase H-like HicB family nuclease
VTLKITKGVTGVFIGQIPQIPGIIVQADDTEQLKEEAEKSLEIYFEAFPELHEQIVEAEQVDYINIPLTSAP